MLSAFSAADTERRVELKGGIKGLVWKERCTATFVLGKKFRALVPSQSNMEGLTPKALAKMFYGVKWALLSLTFYSASTITVATQTQLTNWMTGK